MNSDTIARALQWRERHLSQRVFIILLALLTGLFCAVAAFVLHWIIHQIELLLTGRFNASGANWLYLVYPAVGILLTLLFVRYIVKDNISHGITRILYAISTNHSRLRAHNCWTSLVASAVTIGFGGSVGAEAPIVLTGSAIGSNLGQWLKLDNKTLMLLVGCGAAGAIAGVFKAPIAGLVFTIEVLMIDLTMASLLPILVSCVTATCVTYIFSGDAALFSFRLDNAWTVDLIPACLLLGATCGVVSLYFIRMSGAMDSMFSRLGNRMWARYLMGSLLLSALIFFFPSLYGEGYGSIDMLLNGQDLQVLNNSFFSGQHRLLVLYLALVVVAKVVATSATNGGGGCGGTFAPSLFTGCFTGFLFARIWNTEQVGVVIPEKNFALMGMAGLMSGVMHAPLTGIFLIAELTGGYDLFLPLMIVSVTAYLTIAMFEPHSIYSRRLAREGKLITHHTDNAVLTLMQLDSVMDRATETVHPDMELGQMVHRISRSKSTVLPVTDAAGRLLGQIDISSTRHVLFRTELYHRFKAGQLMQQPPATLMADMPMTDVVRTFEQTHANHLPVLSSDGRLQGYVSRTRMYTMYRKMVADMSQE